VSKKIGRIALSFAGRVLQKAGVFNKLDLYRKQSMEVLNARTPKAFLDMCA